ncbi:hypothetical protein [Microbulbifer sp. ALW1]|uniref:hypothetical protein n=1 Tax=Microbulbifer sp. (strain ALW1) TaxID=1516059 RepID=UPI00135A30C9|nr:hypothetical protein [Microbulbifer sp. ALW1]
MSTEASENSKELLSNENSNEKQESEGPAQKTANPIATAMNSFIHSIKDSEEVVYNFVPLAARVHNKRISKIKENEKHALELIEGEDKQNQALGTKKLFDVMREYDRIANANVPETIEKSLFLNLFSSFDTFMGELITAIYEVRPDLYSSLNSQITVSEILLFSSFDELKLKVLTDEIETLRRKSYVEQFSDLEKMFGIPLKNFKNWPLFVEISQRRNILMHCNGIASEQYISICTKEGYKFDQAISPGTKLLADFDYIEDAFNIIAEVAIKLGHTLWRKTQPEDLEPADEHLSEIIYDYLHDKDWSKAICLGEFSVSQRKISSELMAKINTINFSIAHKMSGNEETARKILSEVDWSASTNDFKLAHAVLLENYEDAKSIMLKLGPDGGELITESAYHNFPLFSKFRESEEFLEGYEEVFGYSFISELIRNKDDKEDEKPDEIKASLKTTSKDEEAKEIVH